jgi:hypothetical protein
MKKEKRHAIESNGRGPHNGLSWVITAAVALSGEY